MNHEGQPKHRLEYQHEIVGFAALSISVAINFRNFIKLRQYIRNPKQPEKLEQHHELKQPLEHQTRKHSHKIKYERRPKVIHCYLQIILAPNRFLNRAESLSDLLLS